VLIGPVSSEIDAYGAATMRAMSIKPIVIIAATLILSAPRETQAAREWLWEGGRFLPLAVQPQQLDTRIHDRNLRRWNAPYTADHTPFVPRKEAGRERPQEAGREKASRTGEVSRPEDKCREAANDACSARNSEAASRPAEATG
jgi:hypothetical protein